MNEELTKSTEDYLESILILNRETNEPVSSLQIASFLKVTKGAVAKAMNRLHQEGYIDKELYGQITLTEKGLEIAKNVYSKHKEIKNFLIKIGVSLETAEKDCCLIEHNISDETFLAIKKFNKNL